MKLRFLQGHIDASVHEAVETMKPGEIILLENLRQDVGEVENKSSFARGLSRLADVFVNDAFAVSHRRHASIVGVPKFIPAYSGLLLEQEIKELTRVHEKPEHPFTVIIGGAKFETKLPLIKRYVKIADYVFVGGALANNFFKVQGFKVGKSLVDDRKYNLGSLLKNKKLIIPEDVVVSRKNKHINISIEHVEEYDVIVDIGENTLKNLQNILQESRMVLWNGPVGLYDEKSSQGTDGLLFFLAKNAKKIHSVVGGGDTLYAIQKNKLEKKLSFVSTGGGAMLEFLQKGTLPGVEALKKK
jgi:phosphoglycerate kinase